MANRNLATTITIGGAVSGALSAAIGSTQGKLRDLGNAVRALKAQQAELARTTGTATVQYQRLTAQVDRLRAAQSRLAQIERQRQSNLERRDQLGGEIGQATATAAAVNLPIIGSVRQAAEFGYSLQLIGNTANMTNGEVSRLGESIMAISGTTGQSAVDVQRAMGFLVAAGLDAGKASQQLGVIGKAATATGSDIEDVAKAAFVLGDAIKIEPGQMQAALEQLVAAGKEGNFEFRDMAAELPVLGAGFQAMKMSGTQAVATLGAALQIARKGAATSSEAANNMANFLNKVLSPETRRKAEALGSDLYGIVSGAQARGENPFEAAIAEIDRITKGGDQKLLGELFQDTQVQNFLRPMLQNLDEYRRIRDQTLQSSGVIDRDFDRMKGTLKLQLSAIGDAIQRVAIRIGDSLAPALERISAAVVPALERIGDFIANNPKLTAGVLVAASALSVLGVAVKVVAFGFTYLKGAYLAVAGLFARGAAGSALGSIGTQAAAAGGWLLRLKSILGMVGTTIAAIGTGPVLAVGAALVAVAVAVYKYWDYVKAFLIGFGEGVMSALEPVFSEMALAFEPLKPAIEWIARGFGIMWDAIVEFLAPVKATKEELEGATSAGRSFGKVVGAVLGALVDIVTAPARAFVWLGEAIGTAAGWIVTQFDGIGAKWDAVMLGVGYLWDMVAAKVTGGVTTIASLWQAFGTGVAAVWDGIQAKIGAVVDWLLLKIAPLMNGISWIGDKASALGGMLGLGGDSPAAPPAGGAPLPQPQMRGGAGATVTNTTNATINVTQQPGQDGRALAAEIDRKIREREQQRQRGALYDTVAP